MPARNLAAPVSCRCKIEWTRFAGKCYCYGWTRLITLSELGIVRIETQLHVETARPNSPKSSRFCLELTGQFNHGIPTSVQTWLFSTGMGLQLLVLYVKY